MFSQISRQYDRMNRVVSLGRDSDWRTEGARLAAVPHNGLVVDICCGTGDFALEIVRMHPTANVIGIDLSKEMIDVAKMKARTAGVEDRVHFEQADVLELPFSEDYFDAASVGFGIRNVDDRCGALAEVARVLKPAGNVVVLEFSRPSNRVLDIGYLAYLRVFAPTAARVVGADVSAYRYLARSVAAFPGPEGVAEWLDAAGFANVTWRRFMAGTVALHVGAKPSR